LLEHEANIIEQGTNCFTVFDFNCIGATWNVIFAEKCSCGVSEMAASGYQVNFESLYFWEGMQAIGNEH